MRVRVRQLATVAALGTALVMGSAVPALAVGDPVAAMQQHGGLVPFSVFLVKDMGGGAYWAATTNTLYVVDTGSAALISTVTTGADLMVQVAQDGSHLLLLVNGAVLVPVTKAIS